MNLLSIAEKRNVSRIKNSCVNKERITQKYIDSSREQEKIWNEGHNFSNHLLLLGDEQPVDEFDMLTEEERNEKILAIINDSERKKCSLEK